MKSLSLRMQLVCFLSVFLIYLSIQAKDPGLLVNGLIALVASAVVEAVLSFFTKRTVRISESPLITGLIIALVLSSETLWWQVVLCAVLGIGSKYFIRVKRRHIFNPAAFGVLLIAILGQQATQWHGAYTWYIIVPFGLYFTWKVRKLPAAFGYFLAYALIYGAQSYWTKVSFIDQLLYANYFFILIMLIEPKTSPVALKQKIAFGVLVSVLSAVLYGIRFPYDADIPALLTGNLVFFLFNKKGGVL